MVDTNLPARLGSTTTATKLETNTTSTAHKYQNQICNKPTTTKMQQSEAMNLIPESIMQRHDPNDDPFAALSDDSTNQLTNPMEYGSGLNYFIEKKEEDKEEHAETTEESTSSTDDDAAAAKEESKPEEKGEAKDEDKKEE